ncbi:MAG TPA: hypothetical protein VGP73_26580 [Thermoanaerobaculia bacterium]
MDLREEALELIKASAEAGATLRLFGGVAVQMLVESPPLARIPPGDIDCAGLSGELPILLEVFTSRGYVEDVEVRRLFGTTRRIFEEPQRHIKLDLCLDILSFARPIDFRQRLGVRPFTLTVADLLLSKLQPRKITEKDLVDAVNLLLTFGPGGQETGSEFNLHWFTEMCGKDWGLFQLVSENFEQVFSISEILTNENRRKVESSVAQIRKRLQEHPKSLRWRLRNAVGKRVQYWNEVTEEVSL